MAERSLILLKPDCIQRGYVGEVVARLERKSLRIAGMKMIRISPALAKEHYAHLTSKPFYPDLEDFMTKHPVIAMVVEGAECVDVVRSMCGATNARKAAPGTIRGDLSDSTSRNIIHASDSKETAEKEVKRFFRADELFEYEFDRRYRYAKDE